MQGWPRVIGTEEKIKYLNALLRVGFDTLDFGSFVSPKAIPQMADTKEVINSLEYQNTKTKLLAIVANVRGAKEAMVYDAIRYVGFPFSISETFQLRNTNKTIAASLESVKEIQQLCFKHQKELVVYISMGFGNPYSDPYDKDIVIHWVKQIADMDIRIISLADTAGLANVEDIGYLFSHIIPEFPDVEFGAHFHSAPSTRGEKLAAAYDNGCRRFDVTLNGIGGCPLAEDELVGNMATESLLHFLEGRGVATSIDENALYQAQVLTARIFA